MMAPPPSTVYLQHWSSSWMYERSWSSHHGNKHTAQLIGRKGDKSFPLVQEKQMGWFLRIPRPSQITNILHNHLRTFGEILIIGMQQQFYPIKQTCSTFPDFKWFKIISACLITSFQFVISSSLPDWFIKVTKNNRVSEEQWDKEAKQGAHWSTQRSRGF